jgi:hypothetical protein
MIYATEGTIRGFVRCSVLVGFHFIGLQLRRETVGLFKVMMSTSRQFPVFTPILPKERERKPPCNLAPKDMAQSGEKLKEEKKNRL